MVKEAERKRPYRPRGVHKEGCLCAVCKQKRGVGEVIELEVAVEPEIITPPLPPPSEVRLDSLRHAAKFMLEGREHRIVEKFEGLVLCYNLFLNDTVTLAGGTKVLPIK